MCKCNECDKQETENCIRLMEANTAQNMETMKDIHIDALKNDIANHWKYIEKLLQLISQESFWRINATELMKKLEEKK